MKVIAGFIALFISLPIWMFLLYKILVIVGASELMWFLYWIYLPATVFGGILVRLADKE